MPDITFGYREFPTSQKLNDALAAKAPISVIAGLQTQVQTVADAIAAIDGVGTLPAQVSALTTNLAAETAARLAGDKLRVIVRQFPSSTTYVPTANLLFAIFEGVGGGGGGGGGFGAPNPNVSAASGGAGGGYFRRLLTAAEIGPSANLVIGAGGAGGAAGQQNGGAGGTTAVGVTGASYTITAAGGGGGAYGITSTAPARGNGVPLGGTAVGGDINITGQVGSWPVLFGGSASTTAISGSGGSSVWGFGGQSTFENSGGYIGQGYGGGGGGGASSATSTVGGPGYQGLVIVTEFIKGV